MNLVIIGLFTFNIYGISGSILQMISHGVVSSALFLCIGIIYERYHTRFIEYYGGLVYIMPLFSIFFLFFILANIALPGTGSFIGELLIILGIFKDNIIIALFASLGIILGAVYSLWLYNRVIFGTLKIKFISIQNDLTLLEILILLPLVLSVLVLGLYSELFLKSLNFSLLNLIEHLNFLK